MLSQLIAGGIKHILWDFTGTGLFGRVCLISSRLHPICLFYFLSQFYFVSFQHNKSYPWVRLYMLSSSKSPNWGWQLLSQVGFAKKKKTTQITEIWLKQGLGKGRMKRTRWWTFNAQWLPSHLYNESAVEMMSVVRGKSYLQNSK